MSLDIPSYYYTDVSKRVKDESWESINAKLSKSDSNCINDISTRLDSSKCIDLRSNRGQSNNQLSDETIKRIEATKKNVGKIDLAAIQKICPEYETTVMNKSGKALDYYNFKDCINSMTELNAEQKTTLRNAIITSTESVDGQQQDSTTFGMRISQTDMELKYISKKLVPEKYQDQFNSMVDKYTDELTDRYANLLETFDTAIMKTTDQSLIASGWKEKAKESLEALKNGTDSFHTSKKFYDDIYKNVDITNDDKLKEGLSSVYDNFIKNNTSYIKATGPVDQVSLVREVKYLSEKWNAVVDEMNGSSSLKFTTSLDCVR
ncbi:hypothetical protein SAMN02745163_01360 [Clostridium cavendishii DSM 21758]|uniref:Uncharacterized protein n=1 Tax=Clostridium cavendishii DSM 21758 TaxID=1121302 RepID=A0A1M6GRD6_9CLOT|nr:hypothetical protein [Clostridium cavendishii]SHJ12468.1 hypothetical protein SAMN02745163_01360 [Clostridium cavendishii DSM 21758]